MSTDAENLPDADEVLRASAAAAMARHAATAHLPRASEAIRADSQRLGQYSVRMTIRELHRLRTYAELLGKRPTELARELIAEGLDRIYDREKARFDAELAAEDQPDSSGARAPTALRIAHFDQGWGPLALPDIKISASGS